MDAGISDTADESSKEDFRTLEKLAGKDFLQFASAAQRVSVEMQRQLLERLPDFGAVAKDVLATLDKAYEQALRSNDASEVALPKFDKAWIAALVARLDDPDLSGDDMLRISAEIGRAYDKQAELACSKREFFPTLHRQQIVGGLKIVGTGAITVAAIAAYGFLDREDAGTDGA